MFIDKCRERYSKDYVNDCIETIRFGADNGTLLSSRQTIKYKCEELRYPDDSVWDYGVHRAFLIISLFSIASSDEDWREYRNKALLDMILSFWRLLCL